MIDVHIHVFHGNSGGNTSEWIKKFVEKAQINGLHEIYLLEHTHQFYEFREMYRPITEYNEFQRNWLNRKMESSVETYIEFVEKVKKYDFGIKVNFGLEVCYIPQTEDIMADILNQYKWDFVTGSVHYIDSWGFDHNAEFWNGIDVDKAYKRYYEIMFKLINSRLFTGLAHPDSIKCFRHYPTYDLTETYRSLANALNKANMYAEQSGGLALNYDFAELGLNQKMLKVFKENAVRVFTASDAHKPEHVGENIKVLQSILECLKLI